MQLFPASTPNVLLREARLACWDFEGEGEYPLQVGVATWDHGVIRPAFFSNLFFPAGERINPANPARVDRQILAQSPRLVELWPRLKTYWDYQAFVSHQRGTEAKYLGCFALHPAPAWIDTLKVIRYAYPHLASYQLGDILNVLNLREAVVACCAQEGFSAIGEHHPIFDAVGALHLLAFLARLPDWGGLSLHQLTKLRPTKYYKRLQENRQAIKRTIKTPRLHYLDQ